jgi:hypothetical protein
VDYWFAEDGYGLLAVSYPSDHPVFEQAYADMTMSDWAGSTIDIAGNLIRDHGLPKRLIVSGWSMSGRAARAMNLAAGSAGLALECFISLSSTPIGQMSPLYPGVTHPRLTEHLLFDMGDSRRELATAGLRIQSAIAGREIMNPAEVPSLYWAGTPMNFLGERHRVKNGQLVESPEDLLEDLMGAFDFKSFPLTGAITPHGPTDARHVLTDQATWAFFNTQKIYSEWLSTPEFDAADLPIEEFVRLRAILAGLPARLTREVGSTHWFILGEPGARETVRQIVDLHHEAVAIRDEIATMATSSTRR